MEAVHSLQLFSSSSSMHSMHSIMVSELWLWSILHLSLIKSLLIFWRASSLILYCDYCCSIVSDVPLISCGPPLIDFGSSSNLHSWDRQSLRSILRIFQDFFLTIWGWFHPLLPLSILIFLYQIDFITTIQICGSVSNPHLSWTRGSTFGLLPDILLWSVIRSFCGAHAQFQPP